MHWWDWRVWGCMMRLATFFFEWIESHTYIWGRSSFSALPSSAVRQPSPRPYLSCSLVVCQSIVRQFFDSPTRWYIRLTRRDGWGIKWREVMRLALEASGRRASSWGGELEVGHLSYVCSQDLTVMIICSIHISKCSNRYVAASLSFGDCFPCRGSSLGWKIIRP